ncbi:hypothetical protein AXY1_32 [Achromobacter phage AXY1]|nr:hypothetical protein AXY1_32 [Achromobacter phage AXY1]
MKNSIIGSIRSLVAMAFIAVAGVSFAHGPSNQGGTVSASGQITAGSVYGTAGSISEGQAVAASAINGYGSSWQSAEGYTGGTATIGGVVNYQGAQVVTGTTQYAHTSGYGEVYGNAPINAGDSIANGNAAFGQTKVAASGNAQWGTVAIGAVGGIKATGVFAGYGGYGH